MGEYLPIEPSHICTNGYAMWGNIGHNNLIIICQGQKEALESEGGKQSSEHTIFVIIVQLVLNVLDFSLDKSHFFPNFGNAHHGGVLPHLFYRCCVILRLILHN